MNLSTSPLPTTPLKVHTPLKSLPLYDALHQLPYGPSHYRPLLHKVEQLARDITGRPIPCKEVLVSFGLLKAFQFKTGQNTLIITVDGSGQYDLRFPSHCRELSGKREHWSPADLLTAIAERENPNDTTGQQLYREYQQKRKTTTVLPFFNTSSRHTPQSWRK